MWKCLLNSTLAGSNKKVAHKFKLNIEHITVLVCGNALRNHRIKLCVVSKFAKSKCFKDITNIPVDYHAQSSS